MDFKNPERHLIFKLFILLILFGTCQICLILNYYNLPEISYLEKQQIYRTSEDININNNDKDFWKIDISDQKITGFENIIIYISMLWGFLKLIDLMFFLEKYNNNEVDTKK